MPGARHFRGSRVEGRKRHEKRAAGHSLLHTLISLISVVMPASLDMQLGALRERRSSCATAVLQKKANQEGLIKPAGWERARGARQNARQWGDAHSLGITLVWPRLALARHTANPSDLTKTGRRCSREPMHGTKRLVLHVLWLWPCPGAAITPVPPEASHSCSDIGY